jgi:hypothetical protein
MSRSRGPGTPVENRQVPVSARGSGLAGGGEGEPCPAGAGQGRPICLIYPIYVGLLAARASRSRARWRGPGCRSPYAPCRQGLHAAALARSWARSGSMGPVPRKTLGRPAISVSVVTGAVRWIRAAIAPLAGPLPALLLPLAAQPSDVPGDPVAMQPGACHAETSVAYSVSSSNGTAILNG